MTIKSIANFTSRIKLNQTLFFDCFSYFLYKINEKKIIQVKIYFQN